MMTGHCRARILTIPILKEIAQRYNTKAPVSLVKLQDAFDKAFLSEYNGYVLSGTKQHNSSIKIGEERSRVGPDLLKIIIYN